MIVSQFWLAVQWNNQHPNEEFEVMVSNLEDAPRRFRFRFVATQVSGLTDCTRLLRDCFAPLTDWKGIGFMLEVRNWRREPPGYALSFDLRLKAGATHRTGIAAVKPVLPEGKSMLDVVTPGGVLRGHWELSLPALPTRSRGSIEVAQPPARVLIAAYHRAHRTEQGIIIRDDLRTLPLAAGRSEHLIEPDRPRRLQITAPASRIGTPRAAARRRAKRRR